MGSKQRPLQAGNISRRSFVAGVTAAGCAVTARAQPAWPSKPIRFIVPFSAGSATDILARTVGEKLQPLLGQPILIENRPGAGGTLGTAMVARAEPDGHTFAVVSAGHVVNPAIYKTLPYDALRDFSGVIPLGTLPSVLVVPGASGPATVKELVDFARAHPGKLNYVSGGVGSATHVNAEMFCAAAGIKAVHIPLKGAPEIIVEIGSGRADFGFPPVIAALPSLREGRLKALAVSHDRRSSVLPDVPTIAEAGEPGGLFNFWIGLLAPSKTPRAIVARLNREISAVIESREVLEKYARLGAEPMLLSPEKFDSMMTDELKRLGAVIQAANVKVE
jgi:tripartite-type tricarboxylate transporter receptor subunit TctC